MTQTQMFQVESSNVEAFGFDPTARTLFAQFKGGTTYAYQEVPLETFGQLLAAESKGSTFNTLIKKGGFKFEKLEPAVA